MAKIAHFYAVSARWPALITSAIFVLGGCGGGGGSSSGTSSASSSSSASSTPSTFSINATVSGLAAGTSVALQDNGSDTLTASNGGATFATRIASGNNYAVTVQAQPNGQRCTVASGSGTVTGANVTLAVTCAALPTAVWDAQAATWDNTAWQ